MLNAGLDKIHRDCIVCNSLDGMEAFYMSPSENDLKEAMKRFTNWLDNALAKL